MWIICVTLALKKCLVKGVYWRLCVGDFWGVSSLYLLCANKEDYFCDLPAFTLTCVFFLTPKLSLSTQCLPQTILSQTTQRMPPAAVAILVSLLTWLHFPSALYHSVRPFCPFPSAIPNPHLPWTSSLPFITGTYLTIHIHHQVSKRLQYHTCLVRTILAFSHSHIPSVPVPVQKLYNQLYHSYDIFVNLSKSF